MPGGLILAVIFPLSGWLADTVPPRILMVLGFATMAAGSALISGANIDTTFWILVAYTLVQRFGLGLIHPTLNATALRAVPERDVAAGADFVQTQYCFDVPRLESYMRDVRAAGLHQDVAIIIGVGPLVSASAATWIRDHVPGVHIPDAIIERLASAERAVRAANCDHRRCLTVRSKRGK